MNLTTINKTELLNPEIEFEYFVDFAKNFVKKIEAGEILTKKKVRFSKDTIRQYNVSITHFEEFEKNIGTQIKCIQMNKKVFSAFEIYLQNGDLLYNSIYLYISKIKALANILYDEEIIPRAISLQTPKKETTQVYLNVDELSAMKNCDTLTESERIVFDIFTIQSFSGLRFATLKVFLSNPAAHIQQNGSKTYISIVSKKTQSESIIPLSRIIFDILKKYDYKIKVPTEEYFNRVIKKIGEKAGITNPIPTQVTKNGETETILIPKYKKLSTHTSRRSFVTLAKMYISDTNAIMAMTSHATEKQLNSYCRSSNLERVNNIFDNQFFNLTI